MSAIQLKAPAEIVPGDTVIPMRGRYAGVQCEVKSVGLGRFSTYNIKVVPVIPLAFRWNVDYSERVQVVKNDA